MKDPDGLRCGLLLRGVALTVAGPLMRAIQRKLVRSRKKARATGSAGGAVQDAIMIPKPLDLLIEMRGRYKGEALLQTFPSRVCP